MKKILFVCHGNICRSPMAEYIMRNLVSTAGKADSYQIDSAATTKDEIDAGGLGHLMDIRAKRELTKHNIPSGMHRARLMSTQDYQKYDYLICMDEENFLDMNRITGGDPDHKEYKLLNFIHSNADIDDPWFTNDFATAYQQIEQGCQALLKKLAK